MPVRLPARGILLLVSLIFASPSTGNAQSIALPVVDLNDNLKTPAWPPVTDSLHRSYTEVVYKRQSGSNYDTSVLRKCQYNPAGLLVQQEQYEYLDPLSREQERFNGRVKRYIKSGQIKRFTYDVHNHRTNERTYVTIPDNSYVLLERLFADRVFAEVAAGAEHDQERATERLRRYQDSLINTNIPGYTRLTDSTYIIYNAAGYPDSTEESKFHYLKTYAYHYNKQGWPDEQRWQHMSLRNGNRRFNNLEVHQFTYLPDGRIARIKSYKVYSDTISDVTSPGHLVRDQVNYYNNAGGIDSVVYRSGYRTIKEIRAYDHAALTALTLLDSSGVRGPDTVLERLFTYNDQHLLCTFFQFNHYAGKVQAAVQLNYLYNAAGLPVEIRRYHPLSGGNEPMYEQHLIFYGDAADSQTAARRLRPVAQQRRTAAPMLKSPDPLEAMRAAVESPSNQQPAGSRQPAFVMVEQMPAFKGDLQDYMNSQLRYPPAAKKAGLEGRVGVKFIVDVDGSIRDVEVVRPADPAFNAEAVRLIRSMPRWQPGKQNGQAVPVYYTLPVIFSLR